MASIETLSLISGLRIIVPAIYLVVAIGYVLEFIKNRHRHFYWTKPVLFAGLLCHAALFAALFRQHHYLPFDTIYLGLLFMSLVLTLFFSGIERFIGEARYGAFLFPFNFIIACVAVAFLDKGPPMPQELHSVYFIVHSTLMFFAYACFSLSFVIAVMYLLQHHQIKNHHLGGLFERLPSLADMDQSVMRVDALGLGLLILGMVTGFLWMEMVFGVPSRITIKIALAGLMALTYLSEHLLRIGKGWNGQRASWISIAGFMVVLITILAGRHGY